MKGRGLAGLTTRTRRTYIAILGLWTTFGVFSALFGQLENAFSLSQPKAYWGRILFNQVAFTTICAFFTPLIMALARRFRLDSKPYWPNALWHALFACVFAVIVKSLWLCVLAVTWDRKVLLPMRYIRNLTYMIDNVILLYGVVVLICYAIEYYLRYQRGKVNAAELQTELARAQLRWLKAQLNPHFLFNALHTISSLVYDDPNAAERMIAHLSDLLRLALKDSGIQLVPLWQELEYLNPYLEIEKARFEQRLSVRFEIAEGSRDALVPSLILQPIVENAIRHGLSKRSGFGEVVIRSSCDENRLLLSVTDNGVGFTTNPIEPVRYGVGLSTVRARLEKLYGPAHSLILKNLAKNGVEASISFPLQTAVNTSEIETYETV